MECCSKCGHRYRGRERQKAIMQGFGATGTPLPGQHNQRPADDHLVVRRNLNYVHHSLSADELQTVDAILNSDPNADILVTPNHHFDDDGVFCGFRVCYPAHTSGVQLPINRKVFHGTTIVESSSCLGINPDIIALVQDQARCRAKMRELLQRIDSEARGHEASLKSLPLNVDAMSVSSSVGPDGVTVTQVRSSGARDSRAVDCRPWNPELPDFLGIYHTYARGWNKDSREHRIYLVCSGGCTLATEAYYNLLLDIGSEIDIDEVVDAEETWWLRSASYRSRCRLLYLLAQEFGIRIPAINDIHAYDAVQMARATSDTVYNDITRLRSGHIAVFSDAVETTMVKNGLVNIMHPSEGLWVFKGPVRSTHGMTTLGSGWGDQKRCGVFPSGVFRLPKGKGAMGRQSQSSGSSSNSGPAYNSNGMLPGRREFTTVVSRLADTIVCFPEAKNESGSSPSSTTHEYLWYDEEFMETLEEMGYDRDFGILELMPVIVGITQW